MERKVLEKDRGKNSPVTYYPLSTLNIKLKETEARRVNHREETLLQHFHLQDTVHHWSSATTT